SEIEAGLEGLLEYNADLFEAATIARMGQHFQSLIEGVVNNPDLRLSDLPLLSAVERQQLLVDWNQTQVDYPHPQLIHQLFARQVEQTPDAIALIYQNQHLTYQTLNQQAQYLAHTLQTLGVGPEMPVGICMERSLEMVVGLLGILQAGGTYVPLDPTYPQARLAFILTDTHPPIVLTQPHLKEKLPTSKAQIIYLTEEPAPFSCSLAPDVAGNVSTIGTFPAFPALPSPPLPQALAYLIYTSGSTGQPKGVMNTHQGICNRLLWMQDTYQLTTADRVLQKTPFSFDVSVWEFFWPLLTGAGLVMAEPGGHQDSAYLRDLIVTEQITTLHFVPSMLRVFLAGKGIESCRSLRHVICSGEALSANLQTRFFTSLNPSLNAELHNLYGPTEAAVDVTAWQCQSHDSHPIVPIGGPIANIEIYILDRHHQPVPIGVAGELHISGIGLARGYWQRPDLTAERFIPNPFFFPGGDVAHNVYTVRPDAEKSLTTQNPSPARNVVGNISTISCLYKTGDLARYRSDGNIEFLGRMDNQVKLRGFRIELGEIEAHLHQLPSIETCVVMLREVSSDHSYLVAYVVPQADHQVTGRQLRDSLKQRLPDYMLPAAWVILAELPLMPNGKVDRRALANLEITQPDDVGTGVAPRTPIEELLAGIWAQVLAVEPIGIRDNFFELGGHSLLATQVMSRLQQTLAVDLPLRYLFEFPTIAELANVAQQAINQVKAPVPPPITPIARTHQCPLSFAQERLWFLEQLQPGIFAHNIPIAVRLTGPLDVAAVELSLHKIVQRHEILRTTFMRVDGSPMQVINTAFHLVVPVVDLQALPATMQAATVQNLVRTEACCPFDLTQGPLLRCTLLRLAETEYVALFTMHHIVSDGWSMGILIRELAVLYQGFSTRRPALLPPLPIQYADFALWQRQWLQGDGLNDPLTYWRRQLAGSANLRLPTDYPPSATPSYRSGAHTWSVSVELTQALVSLSRRAGVTLFMTLMAAFKTLLYRQTNQVDIVVGTDIANRNRAEVEDLIGFFVNIVVLRTSLAGNPTFQALLKRVFDVTMAAYAHQDLPFSKLVEELRPDRHSTMTPLFQVLFVMQNNPVTTVEFSGLNLTPIPVDNETVKFDLVLFVTETAQGMTGTWRYNADLFAAATVARLSNQFEILLEDIVRQPEARLDALNIMSTAEKQQQLTLATQQTQKKRQKFMQVQPQRVTLPQKALIRTGYLPSQPELPFVIEPDHPEVDLIDWAQSNRVMLETQLLQHGAILFRGFPLHSVGAFERLAQAICPALFSEYGDLPREGISGKVYGSTPYPAEQAIQFHHESSHLHCWPHKIWFFCVQPAQQGGATPIVDGRKVYQALPVQLREKFEQKQLMYVRHYTQGLDVSWQSFFRTSDPKQVEDYCQQAGISYEWKEHDSLKTRQIRPAIAQHPHTGDKVFFNQLLLHHVACLDKATQASLLSTLGAANLPRQVYYGDGTPIEMAEVEMLQAIYQETAVSFPWQRGDVLMLDNMLIAHGRSPYQGGRKIVVALGDMIESEV
ncbi:MAG: amino acid adenylation domain-containing protein, partial [Cyanothece sp. SIO1E1]|nr:amino acid adenylation domain-containing protein [Cyanothece sp. SIO1E1]